MKKSVLFALWGVLFVVCAGLGFVAEPEGALKWLMTALAVLFFLPPAWLVRRAAAEGDKRTLELIRNLSAASLVLTAVLLVLNLVSIAFSELAGTVLYYVMVVVASPMVCGGYWTLSLFLWACLMIFCVSELKKR